MRIAVVGPLDFPAQQGGMSRHVEELYARLALRGHDVTVLCRPRAPTPYRGMRLRAVPTVPARAAERTVYSLGASALAALGPADVVHYHSYSNTGFAFLPRLRRKRVVVTVHRIESMDEKWGPLARAVLRLNERIGLRFAHAVIAVARALEEHARSAARGQVSYIPNGVTSLPAPDRDVLSAFGLTPERYVLFVGRVVPEKGIHVLLEAFARVGPRFGMSLAIVGAPRHSEAYADELRRRAPAGTVFLGAQPSGAVAALYSSATVVVSPSVHEGLPLGVLEAMSFARPIVATDIAGHREALGGDAAFFGSGDVAGLAAALADVLSDPAQAGRMGRAARQRVGAGSDFDWDVVADRTDSILRSLTSGCAPR